MTIHIGHLSRQASIRLQGGELILRGFDDNEIVEILEVSLSSARRWRASIERDGLQALARKPQSGRPCELDETQRQELKQIILQGARAAGYPTDRWTSRIVAHFIFKKWHVDYSCSNVRKILCRLGLSYQKPDVKSTKFSQAAVDHWRQHVWPPIKKKRTKTVAP